MPIREMFIKPLGHTLRRSEQQRANWWVRSLIFVFRDWISALNSATHASKARIERATEKVFKSIRARCWKTFCFETQFQATLAGSPAHARSGQNNEPGWDAEIFDSQIQLAASESVTWSMTRSLKMQISSLRVGNLSRLLIAIWSELMLINNPESLGLEQGSSFCMIQYLPGMTDA